LTERLYYDDSSLLDFEAKVVETGRHAGMLYTVLDRSAFYPTSGGQSHDTGTLNGIAISDVVESESGDVWHLSEDEVGAVGQSVLGLIDTNRRRLNCQNHTAQHILSAAFDRLYSLETMSVHLGDEYGAVELSATDLSETQLKKAESLANEIIQDNVEVEVVFADSARIGALPLRKPPKREGKLRIIRIGQFDYVACGGTHCSTSGGVGLVKIIGVEKMRGRSLIRFLAGALAIDDYGLRFDVTDQLARQFTCHPSDLTTKVTNLATDNKRLKQTLSETQKELLPIRVASLTEKQISVGTRKYLLERADGVDPQMAPKLTCQVADQIEGLAVLSTENRLIIAVPEGFDLKAGALAKQLAAECGLKGGGNDRQAQLGGASRDNLKAYREAIVRLLENA
jgi:alanyl-tRNA synthetase